MPKIEPIKPLFILTNSSEKIGKSIVEFIQDNYNKELGSALINAKDDAEVISAFLTEFKDSPETLRSYTKEIERLLLWCVHISKVNISSLRRNHLVEYQDFLKHPAPKQVWCGPSASRKTKDGAINKNWRPFVRGLGNSSINKTLTITILLFLCITKPSFFLYVLVNLMSSSIN